MIILQYHTSLFFCPQNHNKLHFVKLHQSRSQGQFELRTQFLGEFFHHFVMGVLDETLKQG